jgi:hypothetical protein
MAVQKKGPGLYQQQQAHLGTKTISLSTKNLGSSPVSNNSKYQSNSVKNVPSMGLTNPNISGTQ